MKLAEALIERATLKTRQEELRQRLAANALMQEGEEPAEDPALLLKELDENTEKLESLITRINLTNASRKKGGKTLTELLAKRETLAQHISVLHTLIESASQKTMRATRSEVKIRSTVNVSEIRKQADDLSEELRLLDTSIQSANWSIDLK